MICNDKQSSELIKKLLKLEIKCFQHCSKNSRFLCLNLPDVCPKCSSCLYSNFTNFRIPPFTLPSNFNKPQNLTSNSQLQIPTNSRNGFLYIFFCLNYRFHNKLSILVLLMPTNGDFNPWLVFSSKKNKESFEQSDIGDLHIGISNSKSDVYDFDYNGLKKNSNIWFQIPSVIIRLEKFFQIDLTSREINGARNNLNFRSQEFASKWDLALEEKLLDHKKWNKNNYQEDNFNCFNFIIEHLLEFEFFGFHLKSFKFSNENFQTDLVKEFLKKKISQDLIEPEFIKCLKYLNLIAMINEKEIFEEKLNENMHFQADSLFSYE